MNDYKYIFIFEDGSVAKSKIFTQEDKDSCNIGILEVIRLDNLDSYYQNEWHELQIKNS